MAAPASAPEGGEGTAMKALLQVDNVQCFKIAGGSKTHVGTGQLNVLEMTNDSLMLFIMGSFHYVINKQFPSLRATRTSFVFPAANHVCFGLVFPASTKSDDLQMFEGLLTTFSQFSVQEAVGGESGSGDPAGVVATGAAAGAVVVAGTGGALASGKQTRLQKLGGQAASFVKKGTVVAQKGIQKTTVIAAKGIRKARDYSKKKIKKREEKDVSEKTRSRIKQARAASAIAVKVTQAVVVGARAACNELASTMADAAMKTKVGKEFAENDNENLKIAKDVGKATISGILVIIEELEIAAVTLVSEAALASADVVEYKYGEKAGEAAKDIAAMTGDAAQIVKNVGDVGVKPLVGRVVGTAAIDVLSTEEEKEKERADRGGDAALDPGIKSAAIMAATMVAAQSDKK